MPTKNPRLTITLEPTLAAQLRRLSELTGNSQGAIIGELLEGSTEVFAKIIKVLEAAKTATASMKGSVAADLEAAQERVEQQLGLVMENGKAILDEFEQLTQPLLKEAEAIQRRSRRTARGDAAPAPAPAGGPARARRTAPASGTPLSNRGVRSVDNSHRGKKGASK